LYAFREALCGALGHGRMAGAIPRETVLGVLSLILWALIILVTVKYVLILLRADNEGEGGTLTLMALAQKALGRGRTFIVVMGVIGAALFYG
ncbi:KUP/HAK/KT family potassium transporter, partial [Klebsiella pneumoniae]|uniref:KUP/HAK/KT family potassium transporter n=2 Tax=Klebsiella pneumoniae TaxID=573 RepID=UPI00195336D6